MSALQPTALAVLVQVLATQDAVRAAELLLSLLSEYAAGRERGEAASEVCQVGGDLGLMDQLGLCSRWGQSSIFAPAPAVDVHTVRLQGILRNKWPPAVRALAYEVAKAAPVADSDAQVIIAAVKVPESSIRISDLSQGFWLHVAHR
jgi:hypothetical protein